MAAVVNGVRGLRRDMRWHAVLVTTVLVTTVLVTTVVPLAGAAAGPAPPRTGSAPDAGLVVTMDSITPGYLTPGEPINVRGSITNLDDHVWRDLQVYLVMSPSPMTTKEQLVAALDSPATAYSGNRVADPGLYLQLGSLRPGGSASYDLDVPFGRLGLLSRTPGVHSIGVHVIATDENGVRNSSEATGRARSFIPLMPRSVDNPVDLSLLWPFEAHVPRAGDGTYVDAGGLTAQVASGGYLRRMLDMALAAGEVPVTVVADPAVLDALVRITDGSTCLSRDRPDVAASATPQDQASSEESPQQRVAREFLRDFLSLARTQSLWTQGYGRPDLTALATRQRSGLRHAVDAATASTLAGLDLSARRIYLPTELVDAEALSRTEAVTVLTADQLSGWQLDDGPVVSLPTTGQPFDVIVSDRTLTDGGPAPEPVDTALQVRQRLLSESALLSLGASANADAGMVFIASSSWDPGPTWPSAGFFAAFDAPWIQPTQLDTQVAQPPSNARVSRTAAQVDALSPVLLDTGADIARRARVLSAVTGGDAALGTCYEEAAALAVSEYWRSDPATGQALANQALQDVTGQLAGITVEGPDFVTLSSTSGRFPITITNGLEEPVSVGVRITADDGSMSFDDIGPVDLRRGESTTFTVRTKAADVGVIGVSARLTTPTGRPFGPAAKFTLRTSVVGVVVWIALGTAAGLVVLAVARSVRRRGRTPRPAPAAVRTSP